jgi:flagellar hook-basal body complex protein FliE
MTIVPLSQPLLQPLAQPLSQSLVQAAVPAEPDSASGASDRALLAGSDGAGRSFGATLLDALDAAGSSLARADAAERAFAGGRGGLQEMVLERAQADVVLSIASAAASRTAQALTTLLGMQV